MLSSRWRCSRCLGHYLRTAAKARPLARWQSTTVTTPAKDAHVSPGLLERARNIATEYRTLSAANAESYEVDTAKRIGELGVVVTALKEYEDAQNSLNELDAIINDPNGDAELRDLALADLESTNLTLPTLTSALRSSLIPAHPFAHLPCMIEIHPGAGGGEASIFASDLLQMYTAFCAQRDLPTNLADYSADATAPPGTTALTDCLLEVNAPGAYDILRTEAGVHRVQRVPATEKKGRTHTSAVSVLVLPQFSDTSTADTELSFDDPTSDYYINPADVKSETLRSSGAGGQHVNKTESAVRLTHLPTNTVVKVQESRSQHSNREKAWSYLRAKLAQVKREQREAEIANLRRTVMGGVGRTGREDKIRTYNFSQNRVTDHRSGKDSSNIDDVLSGGESLEGIMESVRDWMREGEVLGLLAEDELKKKEAADQGKK